EDKPAEKLPTEQLAAEPPPAEKLISDQPTPEKEKSSATPHVVGYPKNETVLNNSLLPTSGGDEPIDWRFWAQGHRFGASLGANVFLGWTTVGAYRKHRAVVRRMNASSAPTT